MNDIRISGSGGINPLDPIEPGKVTETFNMMAKQHGRMSSTANLAQADHIPPAARLAVDRAVLNRWRGGQR